MTTDPYTDRAPPYSEEAEKTVLGSVLLDDTRVMDICTEYRVTADSFYVPAHRTIYAAMLASRAATDPIDVALLAERLASDGNLDAVGGHTYLDSLCDATPTAAHAEHYITILVSKHKLRRMIAEHQAAIQACFSADADTNPDDLLELHQSRLSAIDAERMTRAPTWDETVRGAMADAEACAASGRRIAGLSTGFLNMDRILCGMKNGELSLLAARPSMGKTAYAMNIAENVALGVGDPNNKGRPVGIFSVEMAAKALATRMLCANAKVDSFRMIRGILRPDEFSRLVAAAGRIGPAPIHLDDTGGLDIAQLRIRARRWRDKHGIELLVVDYLQLLSDTTVRREGGEREIASISKKLKECAKELDIPVLVLTQLNRGPEMNGRKGKPKLSDLRGSGGQEQDADVVMLLRRPCKMEDDEESCDRTLAIVEVAKQRNGPTGDCRMNFIEELTQFQDRATGIDAGRQGSDSGGGEWYDAEER